MMGTNMNLKCIKSYGQLQNSFVTVQQYDAFLLLQCGIQDVVICIQDS